MGQFYFPAVVQSALMSQGCSAIIQDHALAHPGALQSTAHVRAANGAAESDGDVETIWAAHLWCL